jgi:hypothetical protein
MTCFRDVLYMTTPAPRIKAGSAIPPVCLFFNLKRKYVNSRGLHDRYNGHQSINRAQRIIRVSILLHQALKIFSLQV